MLTRRDILSQAADECMKELYSLAQPSIEWDDFIEENKKYIEKEKEYHNLPKESRPDYKEFMGPRPYEFYYLPREIMKEVCDSYIYAYKIDSQQNLLDIISILKDYCNKPVVDKYIDDWDDEYGHHPGYRSYDNPNNLKEEIQKIFDNEILPDICKQYNKQYSLQTTGIESSVSKAYSQIFQNKFFEFLDMAGNFFSWNNDLNAFNMTVYLGASPNFNKQTVIDNWKKYRNQDIEIDESKYNYDDND